MHPLLSMWEHQTAPQEHRLHVSCPPFRGLTITVSEQLGALISIIFSETDRRLWMCFCERDSVNVWNRPNTQSDCSRGQEEWWRGCSDSLYPAQPVNSMWELLSAAWRSWLNILNPNLSAVSCKTKGESPGNSIPHWLHKASQQRKHCHVCTHPVTMISISMPALPAAVDCVVIL